MNDMPTERMAMLVRDAHDLSSLHIFDETKADGTLQWRVFGFKKDPKGFQASTENRGGPSINEALRDLDRRIKIGPVAASLEREKSP